MKRTFCAQQWDGQSVVMTTAANPNFNLINSFQELAQNYLFVCWCERCVAQSTQPDCTSEEDMSDEEVDADD